MIEFTTPLERIGMSDANADFEHPGIPEGHALRPHCLYRLARNRFQVPNSEPGTSFQTSFQGNGG